MQSTIVACQPFPEECGKVKNKTVFIKVLFLKEAVSVPFSAYALHHLNTR
jgi:hypothetical protein